MSAPRATPACLNCGGVRGIALGPAREGKLVGYVTSGAYGHHVGMSLALAYGDLAVADLPGAWNDGLHVLLGITPPDDAKGVLQDIHWYDGAIGYFPSYTLGAMAAAQLMAAARRAAPGLDAALAQGDLSVLVGWLRTHVHAKGSLLGFNDLLRAATGKPLDPGDFLAHLGARYLD